MVGCQARLGPDGKSEGLGAGLALAVLIQVGGWKPGWPELADRSAQLRWLGQAKTIFSRTGGQPCLLRWNIAIC